MRWIIAALALLGTSALATQSSQAGLTATPAAMSLFDRDWVLMNWALKYYDSNHDILLEPDEAKAAAEAFRRIADSDGDGRVTPEEYRAARAFILEHY
jgi:hypothetical protein